MYTYINLKYNVDANLDTSNNPYERCSQAKVKNRNEPKQIVPKSQDLN